MLSRNVKAFLVTTVSVGRKLFFQSIVGSILLPFLSQNFSGIWKVLIPLAIAGQAASIAARKKLERENIQNKK